MSEPDLDLDFELGSLSSSGEDDSDNDSGEVGEIFSDSETEDDGVQELLAYQDEPEPRDVDRRGAGGDADAGVGGAHAAAVEIARLDSTENW